MSEVLEFLNCLIDSFRSTLVLFVAVSGGSSHCTPLNLPDTTLPRVFGVNPLVDGGPRALTTDLPYVGSDDPEGKRKFPVFITKNEL